MYQFKGFTEKANKAMNCAIEEAKQLGHTYIGSEHLLLGLLKADDGVAAEILQKLGVTYETLEELSLIHISIPSMQTGESRHGKRCWSNAWNA